MVALTYAGRSYVSCKLCGRRTILPSGGDFIFYKSAFLGVIMSTEGSVLHDCRIDHRFECDACGRVGVPVRVRHRRAPDEWDFRCPVVTCTGQLRQINMRVMTPDRSIA